jgi:putative transposase
MKGTGHTISTSCSYFGKSRQSYYGQLHNAGRKEQLYIRVLDKVHEVRRGMPMLGCRKLKYKLEQADIKIGRDDLFTLLREKNLLVRKRRKYVYTTDSRHNLPVYDNLIKELEIKHAEDLFVSDISYIHIKSGFAYLFIVGDGYSKKIMGKYFSRDMKTVSNLKALVMALKNRKYKNRGSIHHSDQAGQYAGKMYTNALKLNNIMISMAAKGKAWENGIAERMFGILKGEYGIDQVFNSFEEAEKAIDQAIKSYNAERPHLSCGFLTPDEAHEKGKGLVNTWKRKSYPHIHKKRSKKNVLQL